MIELMRDGMMETKMIKTEEEYKTASARLSELMDVEAGSPEGDELELLAHLIGIYEDEHFPIAMPDPVEAIKFRMEQQGLTQ